MAGDFQDIESTKTSPVINTDETAQTLLSDLGKGSRPCVNVTVIDTGPDPTTGQPESHDSSGNGTHVAGVGERLITKCESTAKQVSGPTVQLIDTGILYKNHMLEHELRQGIGVVPDITYGKGVGQSLETFSQTDQELNDVINKLLKEPGDK